MNKEKKILIIDDEQVILDSITKIASMESWEVDAVLTVKEGLNKLKSNKYSLILSDIMMPDINGFQLLEKLYAKKIDIPVIMITGFSTVENAVKSLYKGAIDFIPKPFTIDEVISSIYRGLEYSPVQKKFIEAEQSNSNSGSIVFVPCPTKYKRLGYMSWVDLEYEGSAKIGATDLFLKTIKDVISIELIEVEDLIVQGATCANIETSDNHIHNCLAPLGGRVVERNERIITDPKLLEKDPYFEGWLYRIIPSDVEYDIKYLIPCSSDRI